MCAKRTSSPGPSPIKIMFGQLNETAHTKCAPPIIAGKHHSLPFLPPHMGERQKEEVCLLYVAAMNGEASNCRDLLEYGVDVNACASNDALTALHAAAAGGLDDAETAMMCGLLIQLGHGINVNAEDRNGITPLHLLALDGRRESCKLLIEQGADVNVRYKLGATPLHASALNGHTEVCALLLDTGAEVNAKDELGDTPLDIATRHGRTATRDLLIARGGGVRVDTSWSTHYQRRLHDLAWWWMDPTREPEETTLVD